MRVEDWLLAATHDVVLAVKDGVLTHSGAALRRAATETLGDSHPFVDYFSERSEADIANDVRYALQVADGITRVDQHNPLLKTFAHFLVTDVAEHIEHRTSSLPYSKSKLGKAISLRHVSYHQAARACVDFLTKTGLAKVEYVQTPIALTAEERAHMRARLPEAFVVFLTDQTLLGGIRRVAQGNIIDNSWLGRVQRFVQHTKA